MEFTVSTRLPVAPEKVYEAWLDSAGHSAMTGGEAEASAAVGGTFSAWNGYISGTNVELEPGRRIVQDWRTTEFSESEADSRLDVRFEPTGDGGTEVVLHHSNLPPHGGQYESGWEHHYFEPMRKHFGS